MNFSLLTQVAMFIATSRQKVTWLRHIQSLRPDGHASGRTSWKFSGFQRKPLRRVWLGRIPWKCSHTDIGTWKGGHYERGLFAGEISRISKFSGISLKRPLFQKTPFSEPGEHPGTLTIHLEAPCPPPTIQQ